MSKEIIIKEFELIKKELIELYDIKNMRASGKFADSLEVITEGNSIKLMGEDYSQQLETGRKKTGGGTGPTWENQIADIKQWILDKGVFASAIAEIGISSLAFLILRKIHKEGWKRERFGGVELISSIVTDERIQRIIDQVGTNETIKYTTEIIKLIKEI